MERSIVEKEIAFAKESGRHKSVRLVTAEKLLAQMDEKTMALKAIHKLCNHALDEDLGLGSMFSALKDIRELAGKAYPPLAPE